MQPLPEVDGTYRTQPRRVSWFARRFPSTAFYTRFLFIVLRSARLAKRGKYGDKEWSDSSHETLHALEASGVTFEITGLDQLAKVRGPCLIVANHMSTLETTIMPGLIAPYRRVTFVVKKALTTYPIFKHVMRSRDPIAVSQTNPREDLKEMLHGGAQRLAKGVSLVIFPQGQRTPEFHPERFNSIGVKLASRAKVPIIPCALDTNAWGLGRIVPEFGRIDPTRPVRFAFGEPIEVEGRGADEQAEVIQFILDKLAGWGVPAAS